GQRFLSCLFALRQRSRCVAKKAKAFLQVHWNRIIDLCIHASLLKGNLQFVPCPYPNDVLIEDVPVGIHCRNAQVRTARTIPTFYRTGPDSQASFPEQSLVSLRVTLPSVSPLIQVRQLH